MVNPLGCVLPRWQTVVSVLYFARETLEVHGRGNCSPGVRQNVPTRAVPAEDMLCEACPFLRRMPWNYLRGQRVAEVRRLGDEEDRESEGVEIQDSEDDAEPVEVLQPRKRRQVCPHRQLRSGQPSCLVIAPSVPCL